MRASGIHRIVNRADRTAGGPPPVGQAKTRSPVGAGLERRAGGTAAGQPERVAAREHVPQPGEQAQALALVRPELDVEAKHGHDRVPLARADDPPGPQGHDRWRGLGRLERPLGQLERAEQRTRLAQDDRPGNADRRARHRRHGQLSAPGLAPDERDRRRADVEQRDCARLDHDRPGRHVHRHLWPRALPGSDVDGQAARRDVAETDDRVAAPALARAPPERERRPGRRRARRPRSGRGRARLRPALRAASRRAWRAPPTSSARSVSALASGLASASSAAAPAATAAAALEPLTVANCLRPPGSDVTRPTPGARTSGLIPPSNARPHDENGAARVVPAGSPRRRDRDERATAREQLLRGRLRQRRAPGHRFSRRGRSRPRRRCGRRGSTAAAPASAAARAATSGSAPAGTTATLPATEETPRSKNSGPAVPRRAGGAGRSRSVRVGAAAPASGTSRSKSTLRPARTTTRTSVPERRESSAPTASASGAPAGPPTLPKAGPARPVVAGRGDDERVQPQGTGDGARERAVGERRERLDERDERDPGRVVGVAVAVRVDGVLEAGQQLVGARVHGVVATAVGLPRGDANRQDGRGGRHAGEAGRARPRRRAARPSRSRAARARSGRSAWPAPARSPRCRRRRFRRRTCPCRNGSAGRRRCRGARSSPRARRSPTSRTPGLGARATASRTSCEGTVAGKATRTGYTPFTPARALEQRDRPRVENRREAVEGAGEAELGPDDHALAAEAGR